MDQCKQQPVEVSHRKIKTCLGQLIILIRKEKKKIPFFSEVHTLPTLLPECRYSTASATARTPKNLFGSTAT
jgi:hypothetical protein